MQEEVLHLARRFVINFDWILLPEIKEK